MLRSRLLLVLLACGLVMGAPAGPLPERDAAALRLKIKIPLGRAQPRKAPGEVKQANNRAPRGPMSVWRKLGSKLGQRSSLGWHKPGRPAIQIVLSRSTDPGGKRIIEDFAAMTGGTAWFDWGGARIVDGRRLNTQDGWASWFRAGLEAAVNSGGRIHFNLSHLDVRRSFTQAHDPEAPISALVGVGVTAWELRQVASNPRWLEHAVFYRDGEPIANQDGFKRELRELSIALQTSQRRQTQRAYRTGRPILDEAALPGAP